MTSALWQTAPVHWQDTARAVVVGVDGSEANRAAVAYAAREAKDTGRPLTVVAALDEFEVPIPHHSVATNSDQAWRVLTALQDQVHEEYPDLAVQREVDFGGSVRCLLDRSVEQGMLVVGKRGVSAFSRVMAGSVSIAVAGRSRVPVIVVPTGWKRDEHLGEPVVVGIELHEHDGPALEYAFAEAKRRRAPLTVVHVVDERPVPVWYPFASAAAYRELFKPDPGVVDKAVQPYRDKYDDVEVTVRERTGHPTSGLLDEAEHAQLMVLGRGYRTRAGFELGSVTRGVLHHSEVPVAVIPATT